MGMGMQNKRHPVTKHIVEALSECRTRAPGARLLVQHGEVKHVFDMADGKVVNLDSTDVHLKFAVMLVQAKAITSAELKEFADSGKRSSDLDDMILGEKRISTQQAAKVFSLQLSNIVQNCLTWGAINSKVATLDPPPPIGMKGFVFLEEILLHCFRVSPPEGEVERFRRMAGGVVYLDPGRLDIMKSLPFDGAESALISCINGRLTVEQAGGRVEGGIEKTLEILATLSGLGCLAGAPPEAGTPEKARGAGASLADDRVAKLQKEMRDAFEDFQTRTYYEILGLAPEAFSLNALKASYYALVKKYHPDYFDNLESKELNTAVENVANLVNTAYETLKDPAEKAKYDEKLHTHAVGSPPTAGPASAHATFESAARESFEIGKSLINAQKYAEAIAHLKRAVQLKNESAEYIAYLGYAMSKLPQFKREAEKHFLKSIEISPMNVSTYIHLGRLYKDGGFANKAIPIFEEALKWDPENRAATGELAEIHASQKKGSSFFGRLFKR